MRVSLSILVLIASWLVAVPSAAARPVACAAVPHGALRNFVHGSATRLGPLTQSLALRAGLGRSGVQLRRATADLKGDDEAAIQDDAPAARIDVGEGVAPALQPLGTLTSSRCALPAHRILSRRSPRGPPIF